MQPRRLQMTIEAVGRRNELNSVKGREARETVAREKTKARSAFSEKLRYMEWCTSVGSGATVYP